MSGLSYGIPLGFSNTAAAGPTSARNEMVQTVYGEWPRRCSRSVPRMRSGNAKRYDKMMAGRIIGDEADIPSNSHFDRINAFVVHALACFAASGTLKRGQQTLAKLQNEKLPPTPQNLLQMAAGLLN